MSQTQTYDPQTQTYDPVPFRIDARPARDRVIVVAAGELDLASSAALSREVQVLCDVRFAHVVVDLRELTFMDSSGIQTLLACKHYAEQLDVRFSLILATCARRLPQICGLCDHFDIVEPSQ
jgi:anti-sigma B factor antagonist